MIDISIKNNQVYSGSALVSGGTQGGLYYDGKIYQFGDGGYCSILNADTLAKISTFRLPAYTDNTSNYPHCSSVEWIVPGQKFAVTTNATALVTYADRFYIYDISDTSNITQEVVMMNNITDRSKYARMACMAYDQENKIMYVAGYTSGSSKSATSPCWFEKYDFSDYITNGTLSANKIAQLETSGPGMHLQDGGFYKGYIYYLCDRDDTTNSAYNGLYIWVLDTDFNTVCVADILPDCPYEAETFAIVPGTHCITILSSIYKNGITYYKTRIGEPVVEPALTLNTSVNVVGYRVNGTLYESTTFGSGTYTVEPVLKDGAVWNGWSDSVDTQTRTINATTATPTTLTAYAVQETVYLVGSPAPISESTKGTSVNAQGAYNDLYFIVSTNTTYPNEYMLVSDGKQNDRDEDITTLGASKFSTRESGYFTENSITNGMYYWTSIPKGYTKFKVSISAGTGENNTPGSRNPHVIITTGPTNIRQKKIYGDTDVYRPLDASVITDDGFIFDLSALKIKDGTTNAYTMEEYGYILVRIMGNSARLNNSYATIQFIKGDNTTPTTPTEETYTELTSVTQNGYTGFITDYVPNANTELEYTIKFGSNSLSYNWGPHFLSCADGTTSHTWYSPLFRTKGATDGSIEVFSMLGGGTEYTHTLSSYDISNPYKFEVKNGHIYINETSIMDVTVGGGATLPLAMFSINNKGALVTNDCRMRNVTFYGCVIKENGVVVRNYVPAKQDSTNTYGVLETTTNTFYTGNGSGFIA